MIKLILNSFVTFVSKYLFCIYQVIRNRSRIIFPLQLDGKKNIYIGKHITINYKSWLAALPLTGEKAELVIEDGTIIGHFAHVYATNSIYIEKKVLIADKVYISDNLHGYENHELPIMEQPIVQKEPVIIGEGSWIGENVCIIGASVGKHCVIGANAVVTKNIPDYCVAVGSPAKVIKKYNEETECWEKV